MKTIKFFLIMANILLSAILVFQALNYFNSKRQIQIKSHKEMLLETQLSILKEMVEIENLRKEISILKFKVDSLSDNCCSKNVSKPSHGKKVETNTVPNHTSTIINEYITNEIKELPVFIEKKDSAHVIIQNYYEKDTSIKLDVVCTDSLYYAQSLNYVPLEYKINQAQNKIKWGVAESILGAGVIVGGCFIPDRANRASIDINTNSNNSKLNTSFESVKFETNPWKVGVISAGGVIVLDGLKRIISANTSLNLSLLEIEAYPKGVGVKIKL